MRHFLEPLMAALVVLVLGQQLYDLRFHPEWTQAEQFWARWPLFAGTVALLWGLHFVLTRSGRRP